MANMRPGDCVTQNVTVFNMSRNPFLTCTLTTSAVGTATALWTDQLNGLQLRVRRDTSVLYDGPVAVTTLDLGTPITAGASDILDLSVCLPPAAGNSIQGAAQTTALTWTATSD